MDFHKYDLSLTLDKVAVTHKYFKGPVNGVLTLREEGNLPQLAGNLLLANTTVNIPGIPTLSSNNSGLDMGLNVELVVGEKVRLYNPMLYDVWVDGKVNINGSLQRPDISGKIESLRGTLNYLRTQFRIDEANVAFTQFRSFEPVINLKASTRLEQTSVILLVNGPATAMNVKLTSEPQMTQQEILSLLTLRSKFSERQTSGKRDTSLGRDELVGMLDAGLQLQFFAEVEGMLRNSLGVDEFRLQRGASIDPLFSQDRTDADQDQYRVQIGKYITDRLMLSYTTGVKSSERSYGARYDITRRISLTADVDEFNRLRIGAGMRFKF
jgi:translocation and assembly module TamB